MPFTITPNPLTSPHWLPLGNKHGTFYAHVASTEDKESPLHLGSCKSDPGCEAFTLDHFTNTIIIVLEGEYIIEDTAKPGHTSTLRENDVLVVEKGSCTRWLSPKGARAIYLNQYQDTANPTSLLRSG